MVTFTGPLYIRKADGTLVTVADENGNIDAPVTTTNLTASGNTTIGDAATDTLTVTAQVVGDVDFVKETAHALEVQATTTAATAGGAMTIQSGAGATSGAGGAMTVQAGAGGSSGIGGAANVIAGAAGGGNTAGGAAALVGGAGTGTGAGGTSSVVSGAGANGTTGGASGAVAIGAGTPGTGTTGTGGAGGLLALAGATGGAERSGSGGGPASGAEVLFGI